MYFLKEGCDCMLDLILFWFVMLALIGATVMYFFQWRNERKSGRLLASFGSLLLVLLVAMMTIPDTYDRVTGRFDTETGACYVVNGDSRGPDIDVYVNDVPYATRIRPDISYGPGIEYVCTVTLTREIKTLVDYEIRSLDGDVLFSTY